MLAGTGEASSQPISRTLLEQAVAELAAAGVPEPRRDARLLLAAALGTDAAGLLARDDRPVEPEAVARFAAAVARRAAREPVSRILGMREFWSLRLIVTPATLDPRPDSETLVEAALDAVPDRAAPLRILDLGAGTGCLLLALLSELPQATGIGIDRDPDAVSAAAANAASLDLANRASFQVGDWAAGLAGPFDLIVSNPPYIPDVEIAGLAPEVARYEPRAALSGGADGLVAYRELAPQIARLLAPRGHAVLEFGARQDRAVGEILSAAGLEICGFRRDLSGILRCVVATRSDPKK